MEAVAQGVEDYLIDGLSFKLNPGASYITNRRSVTFFPTGGNQYSPTGVKVIRIVLTGNDWIDPATFRMSFTLNNGDGTTGRYLRPWRASPIFQTCSAIGRRRYRGRH